MTTGPVALTSVVMKSFERLVLAHLKDITGPLLDPLQFGQSGKQEATGEVWEHHIQRAISTGAPKGCVLSPLLFSLYTNDCTSGDPNVKLLKKSCRRRHNCHRPHPGQPASGAADPDLHRHHSVCPLHIHQCVISHQTGQEQTTAEKIIGASLPSIQDLYVSRVRKRAGNITADPSHPGHNLFHLLPSSRRYRALSGCCLRPSAPPVQLAKRSQTLLQKNVLEREGC
ncbi:hypothetical protein L3Q82_020883 [Scortum barcoo]|uniref:Uncharacterized protein n=1 Tax=Scortum barcoo TaxID=214431 RepID=A0ACB8V941_9TELE|nr:hypothetical protein L3Q82_020883 [Scortum barcoo]